MRLGLTAARHVLRSPPLWLGLLTLLLYLPLALGAVRLDPDGVEYVDIARRLLAGQGYTLGVKGFLAGGTAVLHNGLDERAPLYPLLVAGLLRLGADPYGLQVANALLAAVCSALIYAIGTAIFGPRTGLLAGLLAAISPAARNELVPPMSEALWICLILLATWLLVSDRCGPARREAFAAGAALGLAYLARPTTPAFALALVLGVLLTRPVRRAFLGTLAALLVGLAIFVLPITVYSLAARGSLSYTHQAYLYAVLHDRDVIENATLRPLPSPAQFILANREAVLTETLRSLRAHASLLFLDRDWLLAFAPAWLPALFTLARRRYPRAAGYVLLTAATGFVLYGLTWSTFVPRYEVLTLLLLLPFAVDGLRRLGLDRFRWPARPTLTVLHAATLVVILVWLPTSLQQYRSVLANSGEDEAGPRTYRDLRWSGPPAWSKDRDLPAVLDWISASTAGEAVVALSEPHPLTFFTGRPAVRLPRQLDAETFRRFLIDFRVAYVLIRTDDASRRRYGDELLGLSGAGVRVTNVGGYRAFDTAALWH